MTTTQNWAFSSVTLAWLEAFIIKYNHQRIIEAGSGTSTVMLADLHDRCIITDWLSLEHDPSYYAKTKTDCGKRIGRAGEKIKLCPIVPTWAGRWYDPAIWAPTLASKKPATLAIIDGPPYTTGTHARYPAIPLLKPYLAPRATIILDDARRPDEQQVIDRWIKEWGLTLIEQVPTDKGLAILQMPD
jgi:Methyltransferase domain